MSSDPNSPRSQALRYISDCRFHRHFSLPAAEDHDALTFTYADVGHVPATQGHSAPTILFMPGMFGSRYLAIPMHAIAAKLGVRVLVVDRPGMGNSTDVPMSQRVRVWLRLVPLLLAHLAIDHVALLSHSSGAIYLLNTLYHCREILHPDRPYAALLAPWVDPTHSRVTSMQLAQLAPVKIFNVWHQIPRFFLLKAGPALASSGAVVTKIQGSVSRHGQDRTSSSQVDKTRRRIERDYGLARDMQVELETLIFRFLFEESTVGANAEALQCLRKGPPGTWGVCDDYAWFVTELAGRERCAGRRPRLKVQAYFAENDSMIGKKGQGYMEECWRGQDAVDFEAKTIPGVDHDSLSQCTEILERVFLETRARV